jgi:hypothetical protein
MKHAGVVSFVFLFGVGTLVAQHVPLQSMNAQATVAPISTGSACPIVMSARHLMGAHISQARKGDPPNPSTKVTSPSLRLLLASRDSRQIIAATIKVHGFAGESRAIPIQNGMGTGSDASQTIKLQFTQEPGNEATAVFGATNMAVIQTIDLESVVYADGSTWRLADGQSCWIAPDPLMLISSRAVAGR